MKTKMTFRKENEAAMMAYITQGKAITKLKTYKKRAITPKDILTEVKVQHLPLSLQKKFFGE